MVSSTPDFTQLPLRIPSTQTANSATPIWRLALKGTSVTIGCTNVFDHDPPESFTNYPRSIYDPTGRFIYVSVTKKF